MYVNVNADNTIVLSWPHKTIYESIPKFSHASIIQNLPDITKPVEWAEWRTLTTASIKMGSARGYAAVLSRLASFVADGH